MFKIIDRMKSLSELINDPATHLIDVREPYEVEEVSVEGATNIPMGNVADELENFKSMEGDIVIFCRSGGRSASVVQFLQHNGVANVVDGGGYPNILSYKK